MDKVKVGIIGTGNIGTDLLMKINKNAALTCGIFAGRSEDSKGIAIAKKMGITITTDSIHYIQEHPECCDIVFDATTAKAHAYNAPILKQLHKFAIDMTPAHVGRFCIPAINLEEGVKQDNVNLITCGGQAIIPLAYALVKAQPLTRYLELIATIASKSAGMGTRNNIDEFTQTTKDALSEFTGVDRTKAIIVINPAEPPITMHNTLYALIDNPDMKAITDAIHKMEKCIQDYVPGYHLVVEPVYENGRVTISVEVTGSGDYLPEYAGNLDIITCAGIRIAETYAKRMRG